MGVGREEGGMYLSAKPSNCVSFFVKGCYDRLLILLSISRFWFPKFCSLSIFTGFLKVWEERE